MLSFKISLQTVTVCSFSLNPHQELTIENPLLWSHYADEHRGLCLVYVISEEFLNDKNKIIGIAPVEYGNNLLKEFFIDAFPTKKNAIEHFMEQLVKKTLTIKSSNWKYESEIRIIREKEGPFQIQKSHLKQICFGLNTPESDIKLIRELTEKLDYSVEFYKMERCEKSDFGIKSVEYNKVN